MTLKTPLKPDTNAPWLGICFLHVVSHLVQMVHNHVCVLTIHRSSAFERVYDLR